VDWVQDGTEATKNTRRKPPARAARDDREVREGNVSAKALMARLERQSGQLAIAQTKVEEMTKALEREREEARLLRKAFEDERAGREQIQNQLNRERAARAEADRNAEEAQVTASALEGELQLVRAQLEDLRRRRHRFSLRRG